MFAGAGISTENQQAHAHTLYDEIIHKLSCDGSEEFPDIMEKFCNQPNGRKKLIDTIVTRFDYINAFRSLRNNANKFHREMATMPYIKDIVTTNWDRYFEDECAAKPFVYSNDMAFWGEPRRRVLKIHGTIDNYSSLIVTKSDYDQCAIDLEKNLVGARLKSLLSTKTFVFIGYSFKDFDFKHIFDFVKGELGPFSRRHYFVSPFFEEDDIENLKQYNIEAIKTDGTFFLQSVKEHLCNDECYVDDELYDYILDCEIDVERASKWLHDNANVFDKPQSLISSVYQDGVLHALQRIWDLRKEGIYSDLHYVQSLISLYDEREKEYFRKKDYCNAAYFHGYLNGLFSIIIYARASLDDEELLEIPQFYHYKIGEMQDVEEYSELLEDLPDLHKAAYRQCLKVVERNRGEGLYSISHRPFG
ncbi:SIR2 family protein [Euryhalocaulis caribicus]|uniref:SIR2 family protein n=1 Tax=Euryhalocaulis caribicus TaxID=1161401 RepID=UPI001376A2CE|nr:SIR2 family protein [Euryhalocaulis caribicus]